MSFHKTLIIVVVALLATTFAYECEKKVLNKDLFKGEYNPFRGFFPFGPSDSEFPHSLEYFNFGVNEVMFGPSLFNWTVVENTLDSVASRNCQAIFRFYLDNQDRSTGVPAFLLEGDGAVTLTPYEDGNLFPDYENPRLVEALGSFITAFGKEYDEDARLGFVEVGLLGYWGEWHTYPHTLDRSSPYHFPNRTVQDIVLSTFAAAFPHTKLAVSHSELIYWDEEDEPDYYSSVMGSRIGFHDDVFSRSTYTSVSENYGYYFYSRLQSHSLLSTSAAIGGEIIPGYQPCIFTADGCDPDAGIQDFGQCVQHLNASWLIHHRIDNIDRTDDRVEWAITRESALLLGYSFYLHSLRLAVDPATDEAIFTATVCNEGYAPAMYPVWLGAMAARADGSFVSHRMGNLETLRGQECGDYAFSLDYSTVNPQSDSLLLSLTSPRALASQTIMFSNEEVFSDGVLQFSFDSFSCPNHPDSSGDSENPPPDRLEGNAAAAVFSLPLLFFLALILVSLW